MKSPQVVHFRCLDTFGLRGVAQSYGAGGAGKRLTREGLTAYVRQSRHAPERAPAPVVVSDDEPIETFVRSTLPPRITGRACMPSLVTIEMGLRKPTTWAVLLLTLGVSFGVVLARVASRSHAAPPAVVAAVSHPEKAPPARAAAVTPPAGTPTLATTVISTDPAATPAAPLAHAHHSHSHHASPAAAPPGESDEKNATSTTAEPAPEPDVTPGATERVQQELSDSL